MIGYATDFEQGSMLLLDEPTGGPIELTLDAGSDERKSLLGAEDNVVSQPSRVIPS